MKFWSKQPPGARTSPNDPFPRAFPTVQRRRRERRNVWRPFSAEHLPGVQVIMATHNVAPFIEECMASIERALEGFRWVLLIGDDESTDGTWEWLQEEFADSSSTTAAKVLLRRFDKAPNVSVAKNRVIEMGAECRAEYPAICFMDGDDQMGDGRVRHLLPFAVAGGHEFVRGDWQETNKGVIKEMRDRLGGPWMGLMHASLIPPSHRLFQGHMQAREDLICWRQLEHRGYEITHAPNGPPVHLYNRRDDSVSRWEDKEFRNRIHKQADAAIARIRGRNRVTLVGWNTAQGLGYLHRDLVTHLEIDHWLVPQHPRLPELPAVGGACYHSLPPNIEGDDLEAELERSNWLLICESPKMPGLMETAARLGKKFACVPMWEYLNPASPWVAAVDLFICPTRHCEQLLRRWKREYNLKARIEHVPWPIDVGRFRYRQRQVCERFVLFAGMGGVKAKRWTGGECGPRKGLDVAIAVSQLVPDIPILVQVHRDFMGEMPRLPANVEVMAGTEDNAAMYDVGDVAIQPSRFEGLGLQALECQAAGLPVIASASGPMNEHNVIDTIAGHVSKGQLLGQWIPTFEPSAADLARAMRWWHRRDVRRESQAAREYVEREHSWAVRGQELARMLGVE